MNSALLSKGKFATERGKCVFNIYYKNKKLTFKL